MTVLKMTNCPACGEEKPDKGYLCRRCWFNLSQVARRRLLRRDRFALKRLRELYDGVVREVPLEEIQISQ